MAFPDFDFESLLDAASFQADRIEPPGNWIGHIPFAAWIMRTVRPKVFVELGTHSGNSYLAFCQAANVAQLPVRCYAVDTWRGDEHSGPYAEAIYESLRDYNQSRYGGFSTLLRTTFDDAVQYVSDGSIELLHIDGLHTYEAVRHDFETWEPKLAPGALVMFHDTNVREREFGVWKFWEELQARFPWNIEFTHSHGLGVLCIGQEPPGLEWLKPGSAVKPVLVRYFASLGARGEDGDRNSVQIAAAAAARMDVENRLQSVSSHREVEVRNLCEVIATRDGEVRNLRKAIASRDGEVRNLREVIATRDGEVRNLREVIATRDGDVRNLREVIASRDGEVRNLREVIAARNEVRNLREVIAARDEARNLREVIAARAEVSNLHEVIAAREAEAHGAASHPSVAGERESEVIRLSDELASLWAQLDARSTELAVTQRRLDKVTGSLKWRVIDQVAHFPRQAGRTLRRPFAPIAFHKSGRPRGWLRSLGYRKNRAVAEVPGSNSVRALAEAKIDTPNSAMKSFDAAKDTILVVAHEGTRSGAPILALNLVQRLSARYDVISLLLEGGEITERFRDASIAVFVADRRHMDDEQLSSVVKEAASLRPLRFAIVNSVASSRALPALKSHGVPTVSLVHEFSSSMRPRSALHDLIALSTETVFSTRMTLENAASDFWLYRGASIHVVSQGKCVVPEAPGVMDASTERGWLTSILRPRGAEDKFLVLGVGNIELRKGVDLFLECAASLIGQPNGGRFQFVWIGNGFDPENDMGYSVFLDDQIKRSGIENQVKILRSTSQIEVAYDLADVLLITSRLDPLPNVAIDALLAGRAVLCFEKTTGIADFLVEAGLGDECVAGYLDTQDLAAKVTALADSKEFRAQIADRARAAAEKSFSMTGYVEKIEAIADRAVNHEKRTSSAIQAIMKSGKFRRDFFEHAGTVRLPDEEVIDDYLHRMACGLGIRKPMPGFHPTVYASRQAAAKQSGEDPFVDFLRKGAPSGPWLQPVISGGGERESADVQSRVALHLHAFYPERLPGIVERLNLNTCAPDLFISVPGRQAAAEAKDAASKYRGRLADLRITPNRGRDIGPFLTQFGSQLCQDYDIVGHLHTKKSAHVEDRTMVDAWNAFLLENLIGGESGGRMMDRVLSEMDRDRTIGIVFPDDPHVISWTKNRKFAEGLAVRMGLGDLPEELNFPVGSMFWSRSSVLEKFVAMDVAWDDYPSEPVPIDGTMIHAIERLFGVAPAALGLTVAVTNVPGFTR